LIINKSGRVISDPAATKLKPIRTSHPGSGQHTILA
jgi:hypothetical protein